MWGRNLSLLEALFFQSDDRLDAHDEVLKQLKLELTDLSHRVVAMELIVKSLPNTDAVASQIEALNNRIAGIQMRLK